MRHLILPEKDIKAAYPDYDNYGALIFGQCFLSIIGEAPGPFRIEKSINPLSRFQTLCSHSFLDLRLWYLSPIPVGVQTQVEAKARDYLRDDEIRHAWFNIQLDQAKAAVTHANPLAPLIDIKAMDYRQLLASSDDFWVDRGVLPLDRKRTEARRRKS